MPDTAPPYLRGLGVVVTGFERLSSLSARRPPRVRPVARDLVVRVVDVRSEADGVVSVGFDGAGLPRWPLGAHVDLVLPSGRVRQYSLCDPDGGHRIAVRLLGAGSAEVHALVPGERVRIRGPRNAFPFVPRRAQLFVAGGIGITPLRPMVHAAARAGSDWRLVYTGRTLASMPFADELRALDPSRVVLLPDDVHGLPDASAILAHAPADATLYACGPPPLVAGLRSAAPATMAVHSERFSPLPVVDGAPFTIELSRSGREVAVAADETALDAVRRTVPGVAYSCRQGFCGTCHVGVLAGAVDHRDRCLTPDQRAASMALCVSRADGRVVLDL